MMAQTQSSAPSSRPNSKPTRSSPSTERAQIAQTIVTLDFMFTSEDAHLGEDSDVFPSMAGAALCRQLDLPFNYNTYFH